jgi:hypothetical protein
MALFLDFRISDDLTKIDASLDNVTFMQGKFLSESEFKASSHVAEKTRRLVT